MKIFWKGMQFWQRRIHYEAPLEKKLSGSPDSFMEYVNVRSF
jgi:hypothetical protein